MAKLTSTNISDSMSYVGPVGIGIAVPVSLLDVSKSAPAADVEIYIQNSAAAGTSDGAVLRLIPSSNVGAGVKLISDRGARAGTSAAQGSLYISATDGLTESIKMTVRGDTGNVGIGTTSPDTKLEVSTYSSVYVPTFRIHNDYNGPETGYGTGIEFGFSTDYQEYKKAEIRAIVSSSYANNIDLSFWSGGSTVGYHAERMRIVSTGKVGIGTADPSEKLEVGSGAILAGTQRSVNGSLILAGYYSGANNYITTFGSMASSGGPVLGYAVKPANGSVGFVSSTSINAYRSAFELKDTINFYTADVQIVSVDSAVTMTNRMSISNTGVVTIPNLGGTASRNVVADANGVLSAPTSDRRLKKNDEPLPYGLSEVNKMNPIRFNWIPENMSTDKEIGFIAQEMETIIPEIIGANIDGMKTIGYDKLVAVLCKAVQELSAKNDALEERLSAIEKN